MRGARAWFVGVMALLALAATPARAEAPRLALVVGNAAYPSRPLATAAADASLVAQALAQAGFAVTAARDLDKPRLRAALSAFAATARAAGPDATIVVYLAGYGVQVDGDNYLVPVDAALAHDSDVPSEAVDLDDFARGLQAGPARARVLAYDLAHDNPFAKSDEMPLADGLALVAPGQDTIVAYNAAPGLVAPNDAPPYGAYARALAEMIGTPGLPLDALFEKVRLRVGELTNGAQVPWDDGTVAADAVLVPAPGDGPAKPATSLDAIPVVALSADIAYSAVIARDSLPGYADFVRTFPDGPLSERIRALLAVRREASMWRAAVIADDPRADWTYMRRYPRGPHRFDARRRLAALHAALEPPPRFDIVAFSDVPPPPRGELALTRAVDLGRTINAGLAPIPWPPMALLPMPDDAYYDDLPPPASAPGSLLPIAPPLPGSATALTAAGHVTQGSGPGDRTATSTTHLAADGGSTLTLDDSAGLISVSTTTIAKDGARTITQNGPKAVVLTKTTTIRTADGLTTLRTGADGRRLLEITARADADGGRTTRVIDAHGETVATWRRDSQGIVVSREIASAPIAAKPDLQEARPSSAPPTPPPAAPPLRPALSPLASRATPEAPKPPAAAAAPTPLPASRPEPAASPLVPKLPTLAPIAPTPDPPAAASPATTPLPTPPPPASSPPLLAPAPTTPPLPPPRPLEPPKAKAAPARAKATPAKAKMAPANGKPAPKAVAAPHKNGTKPAPHAPGRRF